MKPLMRGAAIISSLVAISCCSATAVPSVAIDESRLTSGVWMHLDSEWEKAPPEAEINESTAYARLARFLPNGEFSWMACIVRRSRNKTTISVGDGQVIYIGQWRVVDGAIRVQYVKTYEMVRPVDGSDAPISKVYEATINLAGDELAFEGRDYSTATAPDAKEYEEEYIARERTAHAERLRSYFPR
jgi:hypothetical protein